MFDGPVWFHPLDAVPVVIPAPGDLFSTPSQISHGVSPQRAWSGPTDEVTAVGYCLGGMAGVSESTRLGRLVCPACDNDDPNSMLLFAETIETDCYSFDRVVNGVPVLPSAKALTPSLVPFHPPSSAVFVVLGGPRPSEHMRCADGTTTPSVHQFPRGRNCRTRVISRRLRGWSNPSP